MCTDPCGNTADFVSECFSLANCKFPGLFAYISGREIIVGVSQQAVVYRKHIPANTRYILRDIGFIKDFKQLK